MNHVLLGVDLHLSNFLPRRTTLCSGDPHIHCLQLPLVEAICCLLLHFSLTLRCSHGLLKRKVLHVIHASWLPHSPCLSGLRKCSWIFRNFHAFSQWAGAGIVHGIVVLRIRSRRHLLQPVLTFLQLPLLDAPLLVTLIPTHSATGKPLHKIQPRVLVNINIAHHSAACVHRFFAQGVRECKLRLDVFQFSIDGGSNRVCHVAPHAQVL